MRSQHEHGKCRGDPFHKEMGSGASSAGAAPGGGVLLKPAGRECVLPGDQMCWVQTSSTCKVKWVRFITLSFNPAMLGSSRGPSGWKTVLCYCAGTFDC